MYQNFIIPYLYEAQHVSGDTQPIIRSLNCTDSLWFCMRRRLLGVKLVDVVRHSTVPDNVHQLHVQQPSRYEKSEAASAVLGS